MPGAQETSYLQEDSEFFNKLFSDILLSLEKYSEKSPSADSNQLCRKLTDRGTLYQKISEVLNRAKPTQISSEDYESVIFALAAFIDEVIEVHSIDTDFFLWKRYQIATPGDQCYEKLQQCRAHKKVAVVEIYLLCILFGYRGQKNDIECENLIRETRDYLKKDSQICLSPHLDKPFTEEPIKRPWWWRRLPSLDKN